MKYPDKKEENKLFKKGYKFIAGVDEAGRGPLAGPIFAGAVIFKKGTGIKNINDSKKLTEKRRNELIKEIKRKSLAWSVTYLSHKTIDKIGIQKANENVIKGALLKLKRQPDFVLIDAIKIKTLIPSKSIVKGDEKVFSIAAASILAKVSRDKAMERKAKMFSRYKFDKHKGYGTKEHLNLLKKYGSCPVHRQSFKTFK